ncbi:MAG: hypothetical protein ACLTSD_06660 [Eubacterium sp.]
MRLRKWSIGVYVALGLALCLTGCGQVVKETKNQPTTAAVTASAVTDSARRKR